SGQITTSGAGRRPARTAAASVNVAAAWLAVTVVARSWSGRVRECGTFPWMVATTAEWLRPGACLHTRFPESTRPVTSTASAVAATVRRRFRSLTLSPPAGRLMDCRIHRTPSGRPVRWIPEFTPDFRDGLPYPSRGPDCLVRWIAESIADWAGPAVAEILVRGVISRYARVAPDSASRSVRTGGPPIADQPAVGAEAWLMASRPHGNPPHGIRSRMASCATHHPATASGQPRSLNSDGSAITATAKISASIPASAAHAYQATLTSQDSSPTKNITPQASPRPNAGNVRLPHTASVSRAGYRQRPDAHRGERGSQRQPGGCGRGQ